MKHEETSDFMADYRGLSDDRKALFRLHVRVMNRAYVGQERAARVKWPARLRVKDVESHPGVWEMSWEWPDGRATFDYVTEGAERRLRWRRVGSHEIFKRP